MQIANKDLLVSSIAAVMTTKGIPEAFVSSCVKTDFPQLRLAFSLLSSVPAAIHKDFNLTAQTSSSVHRPTHSKVLKLGQTNAIVEV